jgi:adenine deaminase
MCTINPATYFGFKDRGSLLPGNLADIAIISDLQNMVVDAVFIEGELMAAGGDMLIDIPV